MRSSVDTEIGLGELRGFLRACRWARGQPDASLQRIAGSLRVRRFDKGAFVCRKGEVAHEWIGVLAGLVKSTSVSAQGKAVTYTGVRTGGWFGEGSLLKGEHRPYDVVALQRSTLVFMPRSQFVELLGSDLGFNHFLIDQLNERLGQFISMLEVDRLFSPEVRVARTLAQLFNPRLYPDAGRHLAITQEEVGLLCGMSRPRANQALARLAGAGLLGLEYNGVTVPDPLRLQAYDGAVSPPPSAAG